MKYSEALSAVAYAGTLWPNKIPDGTDEAWSKTLMRFEVSDVVKAMEEAATEDEWPVLSKIVAGARNQCRRRLEKEKSAGPTNAKQLVATTEGQWESNAKRAREIIEQLAKKKAVTK